MTAPLALYVHWPYCAKICPYCDFNVYRQRGEIDEAAWRAAFTRDLSYFAERMGSAGHGGQRTLASIYFGGGTPSLMAPSLVSGVIDAAARIWPLAPGAEITLEANPTDAEAARFDDMRAAGINRLSLGVQRFDDAALAFLGRNHDALTARGALDQAIAAFERVSFDLIYGLPDETHADWRRTLAEALAFGTGHLSLYQLTIEPGTAFARATARAAWTPIDDDREADFFEIAGEMTAAAGLPAYETSNHARPGARSRHNLTYWRGGDYLGIGPGAHSRLSDPEGRQAFVAERKPPAYLAADHGHDIFAAETLTAEDQLIERLAMGLRLVEGITLPADDWRRVAPHTDNLDPDHYCLTEEADGMRMTLRGQGRFLVNAIVRELIG